LQFDIEIDGEEGEEESEELLFDIVTN